MVIGELLTVEQVANLLQVRRETVRDYIKKGHLVAVILPGGDYRIRQDDLDTFTSRRTGGRKSHDNHESK